MKNMKNMRKNILLTLFALVSATVSAQRTAHVHGEYSYVVGENDNITLREARHKCIELAKAQAIKSEFGEMITSDVIDTNVETNGESTASYFWENTVAMAKGDWLGDTTEPLISVDYSGGKLTFKAEVWGTAREIVQAKADIKWSIMKDVADKRLPTMTFDNNDRIYMTFRAPSDGYLAVYLIEGDDETSCLLPYPKDTGGRFYVRGGKEYVLFDKAIDAAATYYRMKTKHPQENDQIVVIYSPNPFTKCNDITVNARQPNTLSTHDFQKWLLKCQRADKEMVVDKKWIKIKNTPTAK